MRIFRYILLLTGLVLGLHTASAQYYTWGSDSPMKWSTIHSEKVRMIYPDTIAGGARETFHYIQAVQPDIAYGFRRGAMKIPFVLHPENFRSNGLVMYLPKRVEFLTSPAIESYSMPWYKQLVAHEYRHAVQYNNLNRGVVRIASYILGQQGSTIGLLFVPLWALEGDATLTETMHSSFGRGLQPSFSLGYRAMEGVGYKADGTPRKNIDKWFSGSYLDYIPDHYELGYQICSYAWDRYGENIWDKITYYSARNPYVIVTTQVALKRFYKTSVRNLFHETFSTLQGHWDSLPRVENSTTPLTALPERNHTTYRWPLALDNGSIVAVKSDYARPERFVKIDPQSGEEQVLSYVGSLSTRPEVGHGRIWWTEYRRSALFEQRVNSQLCYLNIEEGVARRVKGARRVLYPTSAGQGFAWVNYRLNGSYEVVVRTAEGEERRIAAPHRSELHGLAWDDATQCLYTLVTDDSGMWLGRVDNEGVTPLTQGAYITLSNLRAGGGKLYFGSIASGKDEAHCYDLKTGREYRLTTSTYGSFEPSPTNGGIAVTTYGKRGYYVAHQPLSDSLQHPVTPAPLPRNLLTPWKTRWPVVNLDTVRYTTLDSLAQSTKHRSKRYRKLPNLINIHSWLPLSYNPKAAMVELISSVNLGVTLLSQNLLSNTEAHVSYGWNQKEGSLVRAGIRYFGLGVEMEAEALYGGRQLIYGIQSFDPATEQIVTQPRPNPETFYSVGFTATLPLYLQRGYHTSMFSLLAGWNYSNGMVANLGKIAWGEKGEVANLQEIGYTEGLHKLSFAVGFSDQVRMAHRDFAPRWAYNLQAGYSLNPSNRDFSDLIYCYGMAYLPGVAPHHSTRIAAAYQTSLGGYRTPAGTAPLSYRSSLLIPRGFGSADILANNYIAFSADYQLPVWYPEGGIGSVLYFKRVRVNIGGDYAQFRNIGAQGPYQQRLWSVGGDLILDVNIFRQPASATSSLKLSIYYPSSGKVWIGAGVGLPF